jgi:hypothetical protein
MDFAATYTIPVWRSLRPWIKGEPHDNSLRASAAISNDRTRAAWS